MVISGVLGLATAPTFVFGAMIMCTIYFCRKPSNNNQDQEVDLEAQLLSEALSEKHEQTKDTNIPRITPRDEQYFSYNKNDTTPLSTISTPQYSTDKPFDWSRKSDASSATASSSDTSEHTSLESEISKSGNVVTEPNIDLSGNQSEPGQNTDPQSPITSWEMVNPVT